MSRVGEKAPHLGSCLVIERRYQFVAWLLVEFVENVDGLAVVHAREFRLHQAFQSHHQRLVDAFGEKCHIVGAFFQNVFDDAFQE